VWVLPLVVAAAGLAAVAVAASRAAREADRLRAEVRHMGALGPAVSEVGASVDALRQSLGWLRRT
jgi:hypothetical protein